jgi:hypothetical protein
MIGRSEHDGFCKVDDLTVILNLAKTQNWQKCGGCGAILVESALEHLVHSRGSQTCYSWKAIVEPNNKGWNHIS